MTSKNNPEEIFNKAIEISDPTKQADFLDKVCGGDEKLRSEKGLPNPAGSRSGRSGRRCEQGSGEGDSKHKSEWNDERKINSCSEQGSVNLFTRNC